MSEKYALNKSDLKNWSKNLLIFFAPAVLLGLGALQAGFDWKYSLGIFSAAVLNSATDLLRKFIAENKS